MMMLAMPEEPHDDMNLLMIDPAARRTPDGQEATDGARARVRAVRVVLLFAVVVNDRASATV